MFYSSVCIYIYIYKLLKWCVCVCARTRARVCVAVSALGIRAQYVLETRTRYIQCWCECTLYSCLVCDIYKVSALANLQDSDAVYTNYRNIGSSESPGFGCGIYKLSEYRSKWISRIRTRYIQSIGASARTCVPCLNGNGSMTLSRVGLYLLGGLRSRSVLRVSSAARQSCVAGLCGVIGRGVPRCAAYAGKNI